MSQRRGPSGVALQLDAPPTFITAIASAVADELERRGSNVPASPYLDVTEAAAYLRCEPQRLYDLNSAGTLRALKDGKRLLYKRDQLDAYLTGERS